MSVKVRAPAASDAVAMAALATQLGYASTPEQMAARLEHLKDRRDIQAFVAEGADRVVGFIGIEAFPAFHRDGLHGYVTALVVDEDARGEGVGAALMAAAETWFAERDVKRVNLTTALHREDAHAFYERLGYTFTGKRYTKIL